MRTLNSDTRRLRKPSFSQEPKSPNPMCFMGADSRPPHSRPPPPTPPSFPPSPPHPDTIICHPSSLSCLCSISSPPPSPPLLAVLCLCSVSAPPPAPPPPVKSFSHMTRPLCSLFTSSLLLVSVTCLLGGFYPKCCSEFILY